MECFKGWLTLVDHKLYLQSYNTQSSKQREIFSLKKLLFKDYNKQLVGTTQHSSRVSDITNPQTYINPTPAIEYNYT